MNVTVRKHVREEEKTLGDLTLEVCLWLPGKRSVWYSAAQVTKVHLAIYPRLVFLAVVVGASAIVVASMSFQ